MTIIEKTETKDNCSTNNEMILKSKGINKIKSFKTVVFNKIRRKSYNSR